MPIYEYKCKNCNNTFEKLVRNSENESLTCPKCDSKEVEKIFSTFASSGPSQGGSSSGHSCGG